MSLISLLRKKSRKLFFTTPSHGGKFYVFSKLRQLYRYDISETDFYNPQKELQLSESKASEIYGTKQTVFLTNGSTSGIITAVLACCKSGENVLIYKNAHKCHQNAVKLACCNPIFYDLELDNNWGIIKETPVNIIEQCLKENKIKACIITSPTYEGVVSDIFSISKICKKYGTYLIVDEAHGALYPFSDKLPQSAVKIADFTVQSLHKTAGGLNSTALLHNNTDIDAKIAFSKINTTSPSYPILASIEANINFLNSISGKKKINELIDNIKTIVKNSNYEIFNPDITKINIKKEGLTGFELSEILYDKYNIEDEKTNLKSTLLLCGIGTDKLKLKKLGQILKSKI